MTLAQCEATTNTFDFSVRLTPHRLTHVGSDGKHPVLKVCLNAVAQIFHCLPEFVLQSPQGSIVVVALSISISKSRIIHLKNGKAWTKHHSVCCVCHIPLLQP